MSETLPSSSPIVQEGLKSAAIGTPASQDVSTGVKRLDSSEQPKTTLFNRFFSRLQALKGPIVAIAGVGAVLGGLASYYNAYQTAKVVIAPHSVKTVGNISTDASKLAAINPLSIIVMPFANQTGDPQKAYIADALTSSITSDLSRIRDAFILPAATGFSLRDKQLTVPQLGKEASVRFVLTGSVTGDKENLRINAVLSDTQSGAQLWTENFDGKQTDLFALQDQVTTRIGNTIGPQMIIVAARESEKRSSKPQVADLLMRVKALDFNQQSLKNHKLMEGLLRQVLVIEPDNVNAKAGLASNLANQVANFDLELKLDKDGRVALAKQASDMAHAVQEVDPRQPSVYHPIATYATVVGDLRGAVQAYRKSLELQPKNWRVYNVLGLSLIRVGEAQEATEVLEKGLQFASPARPPAEIYGLLSWAAFISDRPDVAIAWAEKAVSASPDRSLYRQRLALAYALKGDRSQAMKAAAETMRLGPTSGLSRNEGLPWPGKEQQYQKYIETKLRPAWRLAGLPE